MTSAPAINLLLPVKSLASAKSRLGPSSAAREDLAFALFRHTLAVSSQCLPVAQIFVLTADSRVGAHAAGMGASVLPDRASDLNAALHSGLQALADIAPAVTAAVLVCDLPRLRPSDLRPVIDDAARSERPRHVPDHHGTGTTFVSVPASSGLPMLFGPDSAARFTAAGSAPVLGAPRGISHDLDVADDLALTSPTTKEFSCPA